MGQAIQGYWNSIKNWFNNTIKNRKVQNVLLALCVVALFFAVIGVFAGC